MVDTMLPVNAAAERYAERIARDQFSKMAGTIVLDSLTLHHVEAERPFDQVGLAQTTTLPVACYVFAVSFHRVQK